VQAGTVLYFYYLLDLVGLGFLVVSMQATSTISVHGGSAVGVGFIVAEGFNGDALWRIGSLHGGRLYPSMVVLMKTALVVTWAVDSAALLYRSLSTSSFRNRVGS
jgi:hypothetical protein